MYFFKINIIRFGRLFKFYRIAGIGDTSRHDPTQDGFCQIPYKEGIISFKSVFEKTLGKKDKNVFFNSITVFLQRY